MIALSASLAKRQGRPGRVFPGRAAAAVATISISLLVGCASQGSVDPPRKARNCAPVVPSGVRLRSARALAEFIAARVSSASCLPATARAGVLRYRDVEYYATVSNATLPHSFTAFAVATRAVIVRPDSSARISVVGYRPPRFFTTSERARWEAAGRPPLPKGPATGQSFTIPASGFSFDPIGTTMTYAQVRSLPGTPSGLAARLARNDGSAGAGPLPVTRRLSQLGFLLAVAPLTRAARSAAWAVLARLPGLRLCGQGRDAAGATGQWICVSTGAEKMKVLVGLDTGSVLEVSRYILKTTPWFPGVPPGSLVLSDSFVLPP